MIRKKDNWKINYWDKLSKRGKICHVIKVILALLTVVVMFIATAWFVLFVSGLNHVVIELRDKILLDITHTIIGG